MNLETQPPAIAAALRAGLADLAGAIRQLDGLTAQVGPFGLPAGSCDRAPELVAALCRELDVPLTFDAPASGRDRDFAVAALAAEIRRAQRAPGLAGLPPGGLPAAVAQARSLCDEEDAGYRRHLIRRPDGSVISVVAAGPPDAPCVLISPPCALSYRLSLPWLTALRRSCRCVIMQTRGTTERIGDVADFDRRGYDLDRQVADLLAVVGELAAGPVHLMGICGGAAVALAAAARSPAQVRSLSLWHADLDLGGEAEQTDHQANLRALLDLAVESRDTAAWLRGKLTSGPMTGVPERIGPLVVQPYATAELFYRYAKLAGTAMHWDARRAAAGLGQPCLVVTSEDDETAHPAVSRRVAAILGHARLEVAEHGTHLDAFRATAGQVACLMSFLGR